MPKLVSPDYKILDGRVVLSKRDDSAHWQIRFKLNNRWIRLTTKKTNFKEAQETAIDIFMDYSFKAKNKLPIVNKTFKSIALIAIDEMKRALDSKIGRKVYKDYIFALNLYLIPYFGKKHIHTIEYSDLVLFEAWRNEKMKRLPKASTIGTHNSAFNRVYDEAIRLGYLPSERRLELNNRGKKSERRPDFTIKEYSHLYRTMRSWIDDGRKGKSREMRYLLRDYVLILANTGIRHGTEADNLKWRHIRIVEEKGKKLLLFNVSGKTGHRELVARHSCITYLRRLHERTESINHLTFGQLLEAKLDVPVFGLSDGTETRHLRQTFRELLKVAQLLEDPRTGKNRTLYSLRHMYATLQLTHSKSSNIHLLAVQMGTSVSMIEKHYSHLIARLRGAELAGDDYGVYDGI